MARNLDMTALRAFATVAEAGGVTRAAGLLHLTQSAVSMQVKRLEEALGRQLLDRSGRGVIPTAEGEQLLGYARRILDLNDEVWGRLTDHTFEGEIVLGVPHDVVYPSLPPVLQRIHADFPRVKVTLVSTFTKHLKEAFAAGEIDVILTTEDRLDPGGERLTRLPLVWVGAPGGQAWKQRPLRLAFENRCFFRPGVQAALDRAGIPWEMAVTSEMSRTIEASVSADLAVHALLKSSVPATLAEIDHGGALPDLGDYDLNLYVAEAARNPMADELVSLIRAAYSGL